MASKILFVSENDSYKRLLITLYLKILFTFVDGYQLTLYKHVLLTKKKNQVNKIL